MTRARRTDANQSALVEVWRAFDALVLPLHTVGDGVPDVLVGWRNAWHPVEIKDGSKPPSQRALTPAQVILHADIRRRGLPLHVVTNETEALAVLGARRSA